MAVAAGHSLQERMPLALRRLVEDAGLDTAAAAKHCARSDSHTTHVAGRQGTHSDMNWLQKGMQRGQCKGRQDVQGAHWGHRCKH